MIFQVYAEPEKKERKGPKTDDEAHTMPFGIKVTYGKFEVEAPPPLKEERSSMTKLRQAKDIAKTEDVGMKMEDTAQKKAEPTHEKTRQSNTYVWGYYNEALQETQATTAKSEALSETDRISDKTGEKNQEKESEQQVAVSGHEAAALSVAENSTQPALVYCAEAQNQMRLQQEARVMAVKREEVERLTEGKRAKEAAKEPGTEDALKLALDRKKEVSQEYLTVEKELKAAVDKLDALTRDDEKNVERIARMLPRELARHLRANGLKFASRVALRRQLVRWIATSKKCKSSFSKTSDGKLKKLVSLSKLFG
ncbi:MAG: hypothetical protein NT051_06590 [Candidatus Micrarchaeota archaeon]|nr:hypothetical protein [Candidatus Micrarchaeota archaeon]